MIRLALIGDTARTAPYLRAAERLRGGRIAVVADSLDTLLAEQHDAFDALVLCSADQPLAALIRRAAEAGKHILADGTLAESVGEVKRLLADCAGVRLMVGMSARFLPSLRAVKEALDSGRLGEPGLLRIHHWEPHGPGGVLPRLTREADLACWLFGRHPSEVYAAASPAHPQEPTYVQLHLGFAGGGMALIDRAQTLPPGDSYFSLSVIGSAGAAYADGHHNTQLLFGGGHPAGLLTGEGDGHVLAQFQEFVAAIGEGREPSPGGADELRATQVILAAARSVATGLSFRWDGEHCTAIEPRGDS
jgi:myo-inositol 2-dehydrogenase/D-chiro-inositol 1-dehydrogenase